MTTKCRDLVLKTGIKTHTNSIRAVKKPLQDNYSEAPQINQSGKEQF